MCTLHFQASFYVAEGTKKVGTTCGNLKFPQDPPINLDENYKNKVDDMDINACYDIESKTQKQHECQQWFEERKSRLTASTFGSIIKRKKITEKFVENIVNPKSFTSSATTYGKSNEKAAISNYISKSGNHVHDCGLVIGYKFPFLAATRDGKVCDDGTTGIIEVKCPYSARDMTVKDACTTLPNFCLVRNNNDEMSLKRNHEYYYQVQGQLMVTGAAFCDFIVFTRKDSVFIQRIFPDIECMKSMMEKLASFYFEHMKPKLTV